MSTTITNTNYLKGIAENEAGKHAEAVKTMDVLIEKKPAYSKAYFQRGRAYQGTKDYLKAEKDYEKAINLDPKNPKAHYNFATLKFLQQDYVGAITGFKKNY